MIGGKLLRRGDRHGDRRLDHLSVGLSFIGPVWSEPLLISLGYAFEQATHARKPPVLR